MPRLMQRHVIVPLNEWIANIDDDDINASWSRNQSTHVRRSIAPLFLDYGELSERLLAVSEHQSKSVVLPVYHINIFGVGLVQFRGNGYNWIISCKLEMPIPNRFGDLFNPTKVVPESCAEGFKGHDVFESYCKNQRWFTVEIGPRSEQLYAFMFILRTTLKELGAALPN